MSLRTTIVIALASVAANALPVHNEVIATSGCTDWDSCFANGQCDMNGDKDAPAQCWCSGDNSGGYADLAKDCLKFYQGIRENKGYTDKFTIQLKKGHYWLGEQYKIPKKTWIIGAGPADTMITASNKVWIDCTSSNPSDGRIGFLLGDETYVAHLGYVALDDSRFNMKVPGPGLCGGFVFEAPGCATSDCGKSKSTDILSYEGKDFISHARVEDIFITGQDKGDINSICWWNNPATDDCKTMPQGSVFIPMSRSGQGTNDVTITGITQLKSLADGLNVHGSAYNIVIEGNTLWYAGDDNIGIWSAPKASNGLSSITIKSNDLSQVRTTNPDLKWGSAMSVYGYKDKLLFQDNVVRGRYNTKQGDYTGHGAITFSELFDGKFAQDAHITIAGTKFAGDDQPDFTSFNMCSARGPTFPTQNLVVFDKSNVGGAKTNNCPMAKAGLWPAVDDNSVYGCPDPSFILPGTCGCDSCYIKWDDKGKNGYGWYCYDKNGLVTSDGDGSKVTQWFPDMYKTGQQTWKNYEDACIHIKCDRVTYDSWANMWKCVGDLRGAAALKQNDFAILAREAGHLTTSNYNGPLFDSTKGGNFWYDSGKKQMCWDSKLVVGASNVCYDYDYDSLKPDFKMYQPGNPNYYKVSIDKKSNSLQFWCLVGGTTHTFASDC